MEQRLKDESITEVILATNPTVEGEATAHYITHIVKRINQTPSKQAISLSRIAHGVPVGGELDMVDGNTLGYALMGRRKVSLTENEFDEV